MSGPCRYQTDVTLATDLRQWIKPPMTKQLSRMLMPYDGVSGASPENLHTSTVYHSKVL